MITILRRHVARKFGSLPWRSRSQNDLAAKSCPSNNFVIWSRILKIFHRNDHHIETTCCAQHLGRYLECQGHSMTFQQNSFRSITLWFSSRILQLFHSNDHHIETMCRVQHLGCYLKVQAKSCLAQNFVIWSQILQLLLTNYFSVSNTYSGSITRFWLALVLTFLCTLKMMTLMYISVV